MTLGEITHSDLVVTATAFIVEAANQSRERLNAAEAAVELADAALEAAKLLADSATVSIELPTPGEAGGVEDVTSAVEAATSAVEAATSAVEAANKELVAATAALTVAEAKRTRAIALAVGLEAILLSSPKMPAFPNTFASMQLQEELTKSLSTISLAIQQPQQIASTITAEIYRLYNILLLSQSKITSVPTIVNAAKSVTDIFTLTPNTFSLDDSVSTITSKIILDTTVATNVIIQNILSSENVGLLTNSANMINSKLAEPPISTFNNAFTTTFTKLFPIIFPPLEGM